MTLSIFRGLVAVALVATVGCGGSNNNEQTLPDLAHAVTTDGSSSPTDGGTSDASTGCPQPSDTCVTNPTTHDEIINGCVSADVVKVDITPFYPAQGYDGCALPAL